MLNLLYYDFLAVFKKLWYYVLIITGLAFVVRILWSEAFLVLFDNSNFFIGLVIRYVALGFLCAFGVLIIVIAIMVQAQWFDENILSAQGQLTNMYPVSSVQLVMSKVINSFIWAFILSLVAIGVFSVFCVGTDVFKGMVEAIADLSTNNNIKISFVRRIDETGFVCYNKYISFMISKQKSKLSKFTKCQLALMCFLALFLFSGFSPIWVEIKYIFYSRQSLQERSFSHVESILNKCRCIERLQRRPGTKIFRGRQFSKVSNRKESL